jgi:hypothetical protein
MRRHLGAILCAAMMAAACSGKSTMPTAPSGAQPTPATPGGPTTQSTATIKGNVRNASSSGTVSIAGTSMSAALDAAGRFMLGGVPTGDVQLQVNTAGAAGSVPIAAVLPSQTIEVVVAMGSGSATLESEVRHGAGEAEVKGTITALPPTTAALTFTAAGKTVVTNSSTVFSGGPTKSFADLKVGMRVEAEGTLSGDTLTATRVEIEENEAEHPPSPTPPAPAPPSPTPPTPTPPAPKPPEVELRGTIAGLTGSASAFQFTLGTTTVKGDATTRINGDDDDMPKTFADLKNGLTVEVHGTQASGFVQATRIQIRKSEVEREVSGTVAGLTGSASAFQFMLGTTTVKGDATTKFGGDSDTPKTFADLKNGATVEVKGVQGDGFVQATRIQIDKPENGPGDDNGDEVELEGQLGPVTGTCPAISSTVGTTKFTTSSATRFEDAACTAFKAGDRVQVKGTRNADGSVKATQVSRE